MLRRWGWPWNCLSIALSSSVCVAATKSDHFSLLADFVYLERYNDNNQILAVDSSQTHCRNGCQSSRALDTKDLTNSYKPGVQGYFSYFPNEKSLYQFGFLYLGEIDNTETRQTKGNLSIPFSRSLLLQDFSLVHSVSANYTSKFHTEEINYLRTFSASRSSYLALSGIFGLRFASVAETFTMNTYKALDKSSYTIQTNSNPIGLQVGLDFKIHPYRRFYWDLDVKAGVSLNRLDGKVVLGDDNNSVTLRNSSKQKAQTAVFAQVAAGAGCQILDWLKIHSGYQMLYFGGLALASEQVNFSSTKNPGSIALNSFDIDGNGYLIYHGIYVGLLFSF